MYGTDDRNAYTKQEGTYFIGEDTSLIVTDKINVLLN